MSEEFKKAESFLSELKEYVNTRVAQLKLAIAEKMAGIVSYTIAILMLALVFFLFLVLACVAGAIALGQWLNNYWAGFLIMAGVCLLFGFILWTGKNKFLFNPVMNRLIKILFENDDEKL